MKNRYDYTGKTIFVGLDVHKATYSVAVIYEGSVVKRDSMEACPKKLITYLKKFFSGAVMKSAYEAGFSGYSLHRALISAGIENIIVHAASIEVGANDKVKTDKRDAKKIAIQLAAGRLNGIFVPSMEQEDCRELTRYRQTLVRDRTRVAARLKQKAHFSGLIGAKDTSRVSKKWIENLLNRPLGVNLSIVLNDMKKQWEELNSRIKDLDELLAKQAEEDHELEVVYRSVKGVGPTAARVFANELGDMSQFKSERALASYVGFTPSEYSSGEHVRKGRITKQGKPVLRSLLIQCAWMVIRYDKSLKATYDRIAKNTGSLKKAIVAVARRLIIRIRACFMKGEQWQDQAETQELHTDPKACEDREQSTNSRKLA